MQTNDVDDVIYNATLGNFQHAAQTFHLNTVTFIFWDIRGKSMKAFTILEYLNVPENNFAKHDKPPFRLGQLIRSCDFRKAAWSDIP